MNRGLPAEIRRIESPDGVRYRLPTSPYAVSTGVRECNHSRGEVAKS